MLRKMLLVVCLCVCGGSFVACGGPEDDPETVKQAVGPTNERPWHDMTWWEKNHFMEKGFMPTIRDVFAKYDAKYKNEDELHCQTCHGEADKTKAVFKSQGTELFPLDPDNLPTADDKDPKIAAATKFMEDKVMPAMKALLKRDDLTCFTCHAKKEK